jgi:hypothetical protein
VGLDAAFREEAERLPGVGALLDAENLDFHHSAAATPQEARRIDPSPISLLGQLGFTRAETRLDMHHWIAFLARRECCTRSTVGVAEEC